MLCQEPGSKMKNQHEQGSETTYIILFQSYLKKIMPEDKFTYAVLQKIYLHITLKHELSFRSNENKI